MLGLAPPDWWDRPTRRLKSTRLAPPFPRRKLAGVTVKSVDLGDLYGRQAECRTLTNVVDAARQGRGRGLVIRGEAGTGKTALLDFALGVASDLRTFPLAGVANERQIPYAGLQQLCAPIADEFAQIPTPQR